MSHEGLYEGLYKRKLRFSKKSTQTEEIENCKLGQYPRSAGWTKYREKEIELEKLKIEKSEIEETLKLKISKLEEELKSRKGILPKLARRLKCVGVHFLIFVTSSRDSDFWLSQESREESMELLRKSLRKVFKILQLVKFKLCLKI